MDTPRLLLLSAVLLVAAPRAASQALGQLLYANRTGRAITLKIIDGGHPTLMGLRPESGEAEAFRTFVLTHAGQEGLIAPGALVLSEKAPAGWRVKVNRCDTLLKTPEITFWRYASSWVLPVRFRFAGQAWELLSADLPPRMMVRKISPSPSAVQKAGIGIHPRHRA